MCYMYRVSHWLSLQAEEFHNLVLVEYQARLYKTFIHWYIHRFCNCLLDYNCVLHIVNFATLYIDICLWYILENFISKCTTLQFLDVFLSYWWPQSLDCDVVSKNRNVQYRFCFLHTKFFVWCVGLRADPEASPTAGRPWRNYK
jgi:hypothetical protein